MTITLIRNTAPGAAFRQLAHLKYCRERIAYWKTRDWYTTDLCRDSFYAALRDVRETAGPVIPGSKESLYA